MLPRPERQGRKLPLLSYASEQALIAFATACAVVRAHVRPPTALAFDPVPPDPLGRYPKSSKAIHTVLHVRGVPDMVVGKLVSSGSSAAVNLLHRHSPFLRHCRYPPHTSARAMSKPCRRQRPHGADYAAAFVVVEDVLSALTCPVGGEEVLARLDAVEDGDDLIRGERGGVRLRHGLAPAMSAFAGGSLLDIDDILCLVSSSK
jgi:hypothetical protein